jgi:hypothetical protein
MLKSEQNILKPKKIKYTTNQNIKDTSSSKINKNQIKAVDFSKCPPRNDILNLPKIESQSVDYSLHNLDYDKIR